MKILILSKYGRLGASSRMRAFQYIASMEKVGIEVEVQSLISDDLLMQRYATGRYDLRALFTAYLNRVRALRASRSFDLIWIEKEALPWLPVSIEKALLGRMPYVLDYDDAVFHSYDRNRNILVRLLLGRRLDRLMSSSRLVVAGNAYLAQRAIDAGARWVEKVPTTIDLLRYQVEHNREGVESDVPCIVWIGSPSTVRYLIGLSDALVALSEQIRFKLRVIGGELRIPGVEVECIKWSEEKEVESIFEGDVGIMPLKDSYWERGKCGYKLIQYMACGLPVVASPVGVNIEIVNNGVNGFLASSQTEWVSSLKALLTNRALGRQMGAAGYSLVAEKYCVQQVGPRLVNLLSHAAESL